MEWRPVPAYEQQYLVSDTGLVQRIGKGRGVKTGRILKPGLVGNGYQIVQLWQNNVSDSFLVHRLVMYAFVGINLELEVNHKNGDRLDNRLENLEYISRLDNIHHAMNIGLIDNRGERNPASKLTRQQVQEIRAKHIPGKVGYKQLGKEYGVRPEAIRNIIKRRVWLAE